MGLYRAALNIPGLRFGKTDTFDDNDKMVQHWVSVGSLVRLDGPTAPAPSVIKSNDADGELVVKKDEKAAAPAKVEEKKAAPKPKPKVEEKPVKAEASSLNPDIFGIKFDDEEDD